MPYIGKKPENIIATAIDSTTGTFSGDVDASTINATGDTAAGDNAAIGFTSAEGLILTGQGSTSDITVKNDADATVFTVPTGTDDILFPDNAKILMGASGDLMLLHDGTDSFVQDEGTGNLKIRTNGTAIELKTTADEAMVVATKDGAVDLYHDNSKKLATTSTGVDITGGFTATAGCTITTADNAEQLTLLSTDADDTQGPVLRLRRDSSSPADGDVTGQIKFVADNDAGEEITFAEMKVHLTDVSDGTEDGEINIKSFTNGTSNNRLQIGATETVLNQDSADIDFRIESDGDANMINIDGGNNNLGVGTVPDSNRKLHVQSARNGTFNTMIDMSATSGQVFALDTFFSGQSPDDNTSEFIRCRDTGAIRFTVFADGDVACHDNSYGSFSDLKLKEQIADASSQWDDIKALTVRKYKMKEDVAKGDSDDHWRLGVVAQELETAGMNGLVKNNPDYTENDDGEFVIGDTVTKSVKYSILYMKAVKALQEAMTRIETLEAKVTTLENA